MNIGIAKETADGERRVALVPDAVATIRKLGLDVIVESGAGAGTYFSDADYEKAGAKVYEDRAALFGDADVLVKVQRPSENDAERVRQGGVVVSFLQPVLSLDVIRSLSARGATVFSMDLIPRISRAQSMDALSSQASIAGYKSVLIAAQSLPRFFPMLTTAAGTLFATKVLVLGAGVAGLQAIATAKRLGAVVWGYDVRPVVREQVESLGAKFLQFEIGEKDVEDKGGYARQLSAETQERQQQWLAEQTKGFDVVITTALIPGKRAPKLITRQTVEAMRPGSIIVDLAAEMGGNCELTEPGKTIEHHGVTIHAPLNLPSQGAVHASQMYSRNIVNFISPLVKDGRLQIDTSDEIVRGAMVISAGTIVHEPTKTALNQPEPATVQS